MTKVFVIDAKGKPCLPCSSARARILLKKGKAKVYSVVPFTIQLVYEIANPTGEFTLGIDDGAKFVGMSVINEHTKETIFGGTIKLRNDVHRKMTQRMQYRHARRYRLRYRPARFNNRNKTGWLPPTIRQKKDSILRVTKDLAKRINITKAIVEQGQFDVSSMSADRKLTGIEYQQSDYKGKNTRMKVLWRDNYTCQHCGSKENLQTHHIKPRSAGGTNTIHNLITLCKTCHEDLHKGKWSLQTKPKQFQYPAYLQTGKWYLYNALKDLGLSVYRCFGWMTNQWRNEIGLEKTHINDAVAMICKNYKPAISYKEFLIIPKRKKVWEDNPAKTCIEKNGFKHWDLVKAYHRTRVIVIGSIRSLKQSCITLRTQFDDKFSVSYKKTKLLYRFGGIVYVG